jgi:predicted dehydrogenase
MGDELRFGVIGCGKLAEVHAQALARIPGARFTAYADVAAPAAEAMLATHGGEYATTDSRRVLADDRLHAVYICTRHDSHASLAIAAAQAGKHILIEKPLALTLAECEAVAAAVARAGVWLMPAFKLRYYPLVRLAKAFIPQPQIVIGQMVDGRWPDGIWPQDPVQGGGNLHSQGCHTTDLIRFLAGSEPRRLWAAGGTLTHPGHPCLDQCAASILFANGHLGSWVQGDAALPPFTSKFHFTLMGDGKCVQLHDRLKQATFSDGSRTWTETRADEEGFYLENLEFVTALRERRPPELTAQDGIQATRIVLAAEQAVRTGQVQEL